jgi:hypothetical protein
MALALQVLNLPTDAGIRPALAGDVTRIMARRAPQDMLGHG